eukprot:TRINITY_DN20940_c0_g1_i1.p1 TRINITY_DN20940_c0_g1~~TRINITY_DN20940_c0_g1_i1.p1  ORF type:complete len:568 (+),score=169.18 TRINITY_DN20940_c0_g1_i1:83-1705(+)
MVVEYNPTAFWSTLLQRKGSALRHVSSTVAFSAICATLVVVYYIYFGDGIDGDSRCRAESGARGREAAARRPAARRSARGMAGATATATQPLEAATATESATATATGPARPASGGAGADCSRQVLVSSQMHSLLLSAVALLIVFRTDIAYRRYRKGQQLVDRLRQGLLHVVRHSVVWSTDVPGAAEAQLGLRRSCMTLAQLCIFVLRKHVPLRGAAGTIRTTAPLCRRVQCSPADTLQTALGVTFRGAVVCEVTPGGPCAAAGVAPGWVLAELGGHPVEDSVAAEEALGEAQGLPAPPEALFLGSATREEPLLDAPTLQQWRRLIADMRYGKDRAEAWADYRKAFALAVTERVAEVSGLLVSLTAAGALTPQAAARIDEELQDVADACSEIWVIHTSPTPFPYVQLTHLLIVLFLGSLPATVVHSYLWGTIPLVAVTSAFYFGINRVAMEIQDPFGTDENDFDLGTLFRELQEAVHDVSEMRLPPGAGQRQLARKDHTEGAAGPRAAQWVACVARLRCGGAARDPQGAHTQRAGCCSCTA